LSTDKFTRDPPGEIDWSRAALVSGMEAYPLNDPWFEEKLVLNPQVLVVSD
jgi:hypothetical protein